MGGFLITLEGIEGSGKSTQADLLAGRLSGSGLPVVCSREPGGTPLGVKLRSLLLAPGSSSERWCPEAELMLFCADRAQHLETLVRPALSDGRIVVLDRFEDSTRAYQGAQGIPEATLDTLKELILKDLRPDLTLLFDADPANTLKRVDSRNRSVTGFNETRFDDEDLIFHNKVRDGFLKIASREPGRVVIIKADDDPATIAEDVWSVVMQKLKSADFVLV